MHKLERIDALLEFDVFIGELGFVFSLAQLLLDQLLSALRERREASARNKKTRRSQYTDYGQEQAMWGLRDRGMRVWMKGAVLT